MSPSTPHPRGLSLRRRRGFSLLEVMVALSILVTSLVILMEIQSTAVRMTRDAERLLTATQLAQEKLTEVVLTMEEDGFGESDICDFGSFRDFGDDMVELQFGDALRDYHFEWCVTSIELGALGDLAGLASTLGDAGLGGGLGDEMGSPAADVAGGLDLAAFGLGPEMISEMLGRYIREVRVRVWWGQSSRRAEELGDEIILTSHIINPSGILTETGAQPGGDE